MRVSGGAGGLRGAAMRPTLPSMSARPSRAVPLGLDGVFAPRIKAVLGPTNTGKTHLAMERLLAHASGIIGFPLRLLARENYDRMVARKGARHVALITGEEKIVPPEACWFSCTVEAMPLDREVEFVAVDEIQLCADPDRGHVFTDRLLHARGRSETMFLGAETIRHLLQRLVPGVSVDTRPRLSELSYAGPAKLTRLPPRSAIVAFSAAEVYALAEMIRRRRGGCAVVMGRLSPRTRNAQVALYQDKEVDFLVATDAIGMGLNMDVDHVAFANLVKFDGNRPRALAAAEVAQVAGRAGRGMRDGTFGVTGTCPPLAPELVEAVENHQFDALEVLAWRNSDLDFTALDALIASLQAPPPGPGLARGNESSDLTTLLALARDTDLARLAHGRAALRQLWDVCQVPDFRKLSDDSHVALCGRLFRHLRQDGSLPDDWLRGQILSLARTDGDIDTLMQRLAGIRVWSYVTARTDWVEDAAGLQAQAREVEDKLSDSLHENLTSRFVDRRSTLLIRRLEAKESETLLSAVTARGEVIVEGHPVGHVDGFVFRPDAAAEGEERRLVMRAARRALAAEIPRRVTALLAEPDSAFTLRPDGTLLWRDVPVARLKRGAHELRPNLHPLPSEFLDGSQREAVRLRLVRMVEAHLHTELAPLFAARDAARAEPTLRGALHELIEAGGVVPGARTVSPEARAGLKRLGVRAGRHALYLPALLKPRAMQLRALLWSLATGRAAPQLPRPGLVSVPLPEGWPPGFALRMGWVETGPVLLRLDVAERVAAELTWETRRRPAALPAGLCSRLSLRAEWLPAVLRALGVRLLPAVPLPEGTYGPPAPPMMASLRPTAKPARPDKPAVPPPVIQPTGPFAALARLRG
jgi:ATP-dependent RNA helicase SUPV3L1/SUV3